MLERLKHLNVVCCIPHSGTMVSQFVIALTDMMVYYNNHRVGEYRSQELGTNFVRGSILPKQRREAMLDALERKATKLLWIDSDHSFPKNMVHRMVHFMDKNKYRVLACNHATKTMPAQPTARYAPRPGTDDPKHGRPCYTDADSPEFEKVWRVGTGTMMVDVGVYRDMSESERNHLFDMFFRDDVQNYQGEDWTMAEMFEKQGEEIWIDHRLSDQCLHWGMFGFSHEHVGSLEKIQHIQSNPKIASAIQEAFGKPTVEIARG